METNIKFYAADLAAYNNGTLHGVWIDATSDADDMQDAVDAMLAQSPVPDAEEWIIHDYDDSLKCISHLGETSDLLEIANIMESVEELSDDYDDSILPMLIEWVSERADSIHWKSHLDDAFAGLHNSGEDYAMELLEDTGEVAALPDYLQGYFDYRAFARDMAIGGEVDFICTSTGRYLQDHDSMSGRECIVLRNL